MLLIVAMEMSLERLLSWSSDRMRAEGFGKEQVGQATKLDWTHWRNGATNLDRSGILWRHIRTTCLVLLL